MKLIGFAGLRRSGKDTAAKALTDLGWTKISFAGPLKAMLITLLSVRGAGREMFRMVEGDLKEVPTPFLDGRTPRHAMQTLGTEWGRDQMSKDIWVNAAIDKARRLKHAVITDVRFPNEAEAIQRAGGKIVKIIRPGLAVDSHPSEALVDSIHPDLCFLNSGSIEELQQWVSQLPEYFYGTRK